MDRISGSGASASLRERDVFRAVESDDFAARVAAASSIDGAIGLIDRSAEFGALLELILQGGYEAEIAVLTELVALSTRQTDATYANPYDAAMCAYSLALHRRGSDVTGAALSLLDGARGSWWAPLLSYSLRVHPQQKSAAGTENEFAAGGRIALGVAAMSPTVEFFLIPDRHWVAVRPTFRARLTSSAGLSWRDEHDILLASAATTETADQIVGS